MWKYLYVTLWRIAIPVLYLWGNFDVKLKKFVRGREKAFAGRRHPVEPGDKVFWMHCASLGEFEQGLPVLEAFRKAFPGYKTVVSFFSPSGYDAVHDKHPADAVVYLPFDIPSKVRSFLDEWHPDIAVFVKYEFWPVLLDELRNQDVPTFLISGIFRKGQFLMRRSLQAFTRFFVQDERSAEILLAKGFQNVSITGDTRFDRVSEIASTVRSFPDIEKWIRERKVLVAGSTWEPGEKMLSRYLAGKPAPGSAFIIAPHRVDNAHIENLVRSLPVPSVRYSGLSPSGEIPMEAQVLIIDTVGMLSQLYRYAHIAYVGGGFGAGIHNILEAAVYGIPILIGPKYRKFKEAVDLVSLQGAFVVENDRDFTRLLDDFFAGEVKRTDAGHRCREYILQNTRATQKIMEVLQRYT